MVADGRQIWTSGLVERDQVISFDVSIESVNDLRLMVTDGGDGGYNDRADWLDLVVVCS